MPYAKATRTRDGRIVPKPMPAPIRIPPSTPPPAAQPPIAATQQG